MKDLAEFKAWVAFELSRNGHSYQFGTVKLQGHNDQRQIWAAKCTELGTGTTYFLVPLESDVKQWDAFVWADEEHWTVLRTDQMLRGIRCEVRQLFDFTLRQTDYWRMTDQELERKANKYHIPPWSRAGDQGQHWYVDRERIIHELVYRDSVLRAASEDTSQPVYDQSLREKTRVTVLGSLWVLECEESFKQGTAFYLRDVGLITCQHVLGPRTKAFKATRIEQKYDLEILAQSEVLDIAVLRIGAGLGLGLPRGDPSILQHMDEIMVSGFPNYHLGDSGVILQGKVTGFRTVSTVRRILTDVPIVAGNSGGPAVVPLNQVVGVAVTGADIMERAQETENHGIIPIDVVDQLLKEQKK